MDGNVWAVCVWSWGQWGPLPYKTNDLSLDYSEIYLCGQKEKRGIRHHKHSNFLLLQSCVLSDLSYWTQHCCHTREWSLLEAINTRHKGGDGEQSFYGCDIRVLFTDNLLVWIEPICTVNLSLRNVFVLKKWTWYWFFKIFLLWKICNHCKLDLFITSRVLTEIKWLFIWIILFDHNPLWVNS